MQNSNEIKNQTDENGLKQGLWKEYSLENKAYYEILNYRDGKIEGEVRGYYPSGKLEYIKIFSNNKLNGECKWFRVSGEILHTQFYKNGKYHGESKWYNKDGSISKITIFNNDKMIKKNDYEKLRTKKLNSYDKNDLRQGIHLDYRNKESKLIHSRANYKDNKLNGFKIEYHYDTYHIKTITYYKNDKKEGKCMGFFDTGLLHYLGNYKNGLEEGEWCWYYENGLLRYMEFYNEGKLIKKSDIN